MTDIVYVNGDSFSAGADLADYLLPDYPEQWTLNDLINNYDPDIGSRYVNWRHKFYDARSEFYSQDALNAQDRLRWSSILASTVDRTVINNSYAGADNYSITVRSCNDIQKLISKGYTITHVIIQFTGFNRYSYVRNSNNSRDNRFYYDIRNQSKSSMKDGFYLRHIKSSELNTGQLTDKESKFLEKEVLDELVYEDQDSSSRLLSHLLTLKLYKDAIKGVSGVDPIFVDSLFMKSYFRYTDTEKHLISGSYINDVFNYIFPGSMLSMYDIPDFYNEKSITGGRHFDRFVHEKFSKLLAERYFK